MFTDESRLHLNNNDRSRVYRRVGERYADACVIKIDRLVESVVLGVITERGRIALVIVAGNLNRIRYRDKLFSAILFRSSKLRPTT